MRSETIHDNRIDDANPVVELVLTSLDDDKAHNIVSIPLAGKSSIADHMIIASGSSSRQLSAMADHLERRLKDSGRRPMGTEGVDSGDWILIDVGDVIVHLFRPEVREFYQLEKMWGDAGHGVSGKGELVTIGASSRP